jgi:hypothetical protein
MNAIFSLIEHVKKNETVCAMLGNELSGLRSVLDDLADDAELFGAAEGMKGILEKTFEKQDMLVYFIASSCYRAGFQDCQTGKTDIMRSLEK